MATTQFEQNIKNSFAAAKKDADTIKADVTTVKTDMSAFKDNMSEWLQYFEKANSEMAAKIAVLERRIVELESEKIAKSMQAEELHNSLRFERDL